MKKITASLAIALNMLVLHKGLGAVLVTYSTTAPTEDIVISNSGSPTTTLSARWTPALGKRDVGQTFTTTEDFMLGSISLYTTAASASTIDRHFTLTIESFATSSPTSERSLISEQSGVLPSFGQGAQYVTFNLDTPVNISGGVVYGFRLSFDTEDASSAMTLSFQGAYTGGTGYQIVYATSENPSTLSNDLAFYLAAAAPIPEPTAGAMIGLGSAGLLLYCRRRRGGPCNSTGNE